MPKEYQKQLCRQVALFFLSVLKDIKTLIKHEMATAKKSDWIFLFLGSSALYFNLLSNDLKYFIKKKTYFLWLLSE